MNILFICSRNQWRSPTAEALFAELDGIEAYSAGTDNDAETVMSGDLIEWADTVFCMEQKHKRKVQAAFANQLKGKDVKVLGIADHYTYMDPTLVKVIKSKFPRWFG